MKTIGKEIFSWCSKLQSIHISKKLKTIQKNMFDGCYELNTITIDENNDYLKVIDNVIYSKDNKILIF